MNESFDKMFYNKKVIDINGDKDYLIMNKEVEKWLILMIHG